MEKTTNAHVVPAQFDWDDVGSWDSLLRTVSLDARGNALVGQSEAMECRGCVAYNATTRLQVFSLGLTDIAIVVTDDKVVVFPVSRAQEVRKLSDLDQHGT